MATEKSAQISATELELKRRGRRRLVGAVAIGLLGVVFLPMIFDSEPKREKAANQEIAIQIPPRDGQTPLPKPAAPTVPSSSLGAAPKALPAPMEAIPPQLPATKLGNEKSGSATAPTPIPVPQTPPPKAAIVTPTPTPTPAPTKVEPKPAPEAVKVPPRVETPKPELVKPEPPKVEPPKAAPPVVAPKAVDSKGAFVVQIGAYKDADNAQQIVARMKEAKLVVFTDKIATQSGEVTRVRVGPFSTREKADAALAQVKLAGSDGKVVPQ